MYFNGRKSVAAIALGFVLLSAQRGQAQGDALNFFKNYFITGDYQVGGVGLSSTGVDGIATGTIYMNDVPTNAEILAAFLYWQVVSTESDGPESGIVGATFNGFPLSTPEGPLAKVLAPGGTAPCWSSGGGTGQSGGSKRTYTYRADVLRFIRVDESTGRHVVNGPHSIQAPDSGKGNGTPNALGASLVVIYRNPDPLTPLNAIVIYDGGYTIDNGTPMMSQTIAGFYDPADAEGKMTHIVGSGQANKEERLLVDGNVAIINPFRASQGPDWDNYTFATSPAGGPSLITSVDDVGIGSSDCLSWGAIIFRTEVQDTDEDGLLDRWELEQLTDPNGLPLPDLAAMGANPMRKDIFVEVGYMETIGEVSYGGEPESEHTHLPTAAALKMVGEAFEDAPVYNPDGTYGIDVHFDVGNNYQMGEAGSYIIPEGLARGGEAMNELDTQCVRGPDDPPWVCQFSEYPGTVGWKSGFRYFKDALLDRTVPEDDCDAPGNDGPGESCERRFDRNRKDMFRYALFAHALGVPKEACIGADGFPDEVCQDENPDYHVPQTFTGVADFPGGDIMVTLGGFDDLEGRPVGTDFWQASTLMHEWGHNLGRRHGGDLLEPNCKTNYLSVMNYLFQLRGLIDEDGVPHLDFSRQTLAGFDETGLSDPGALGLVSYRTAWYAPLVPGTIGDILSIPVATRHCDGSPLLETDVPMVRLDANGVAEPIDWNGNGEPDSFFSQDINFDGDTTELYASSNDWDNLHLDQVGSRRNVGGWFYIENPATGELVAFMGPLSLDTGRGDLGRGDLGRGDLGRGDLGRGDLGRGDLGRGDLGRGDLGRGDLGRGDLGRGDLGRGDLGRGDLGRGDLGVGADDGLFEIDKDLARELANSPANELRASVVGIEDECDGLTPAECHRIRLDWKASHVGSVFKYYVRRFEGDTITPASVVVDVGEVSFVSGQVDYFSIDTEELPNGAFTYFVVAEFNDGTMSNPSIFVTITAVNDPPAAEDDGYSTDAGTPLDVAASGVLDNDMDVDSPSLTAEVVDGPANGTLTLSDDGSFTYTPDAGFVGDDSFTYNTNDVDPTRSSEGTVTITVNGQLYGFEPVKNLPPSAGKEFRSGSSIPLEWKFTMDDVPVDSSDAAPQITITGPSGAPGVLTFTAEDPGSSSFRPPSSPSWVWHFNWQTDDDTGNPLPKGSYRVEVTSQKTGQTFDGGTIVLK